MGSLQTQKLLISLSDVSGYKTRHGLDRLLIKPPFTYQQDITTDNFHEVIDLILRDSSYVHNQYSSAVILAAVLEYCGRPWWTVRDAKHTVLGFIMVGVVGDLYATCNYLYIAKEARGQGLAEELYRRSTQPFLNSQYHFGAYYTQGGLKIATKVFGELDSKERGLTVRFGKPNINGLSSHITDDKSRIAQYRPGPMFKNLVEWDTSMVHNVQRESFWKIFLHHPSVHTYVAFDLNNNDIIGFGSIQPAFDQSCMIIAPLYAQNDATAVGIFHKLLQHVRAEQKVMLSHYTENKAMSDIFDSLEVPQWGTGFFCSQTPSPFPKNYQSQMYLSCANAFTLQ